MPVSYAIPPEMSIFRSRALDVRFVFRYNKNESKLILIAIERNIP